MTTPEDPHLPSRLRANAVIRDGEARVGRAWFRSLTRWMDRMRPDVIGGDRIRIENIGQHSAFWGELMRQEVIPETGSLFTRIFGRITSRPEPVTGVPAAAYLNEVGNRLRHVPDEVYALVVREVEEGIARGEGIPDITRRVQSVLTSTGTPYWKNRALTVARTETLAAVNAGTYHGAIADAAERGDPAPFKVWLATADQRTRPTHKEADQQQVPLHSPFKVGGADLLFPGDPRGPAQEVIMCRCTLLPVVLGETIDWADRQDP